MKTITYAICWVLAAGAASAHAQSYPTMMPDAKVKLEEVGTQLNPMSPEQFATFLGSEIAKYAKLIKAANVSIE